MDANNDDRPKHHLDTLDNAIDHRGGSDVIYDDLNCTDDACTHDHYVVVPLDEYRALVAAARDRHPAGQQRGPDPATRADNYICPGCGYYSCICLLAADP